ncbi:MULTISPECIES: hypothetical protein [unclassified Leptospira]|uniref:hypothetical protein n=1 Tax=unclassified Leptospira TaxID=2633828 RepID=UPI0002C02A6C|nr:MULTISPECIES: hypothetical protein [unclassified Leptospira]EMJ99128.1 hypothetical protein LEP1GSC192_0476 [Leptospira sp. B5-022]MCR1795814.1 hypothetical protein [Leptospira sp. id769339]
MKPWIKYVKTILLIISLVYWMRIEGQSQQFTIAGIPVYCTDPSGRPVTIVLVRQLRDIAVSNIESNGLPTIKIDIDIFFSKSPLIQMYFFAHECGHHISGDMIRIHYQRRDSLNREKTADRIGIRMLRDQLKINLDQVNEIANSLRNNPGMFPYYLPGPERAKWILDCFRTNTDNCEEHVVINPKDCYAIETAEKNICASDQRLCRRDCQKEYKGNRRDIRVCEDNCFESKLQCDDEANLVVEYCEAKNNFSRLSWGPNEGPQNWQNASSICSTKRMRLPSLPEFLVAYERSVHRNWADCNGCSHNYWSSTTVDVGKVKVVNMNSGTHHTQRTNQDATFEVRCVSSN